MEEYLLYIWLHEANSPMADTLTKFMEDKIAAYEYSWGEYPLYLTVADGVSHAND